ncbi:MAG TPA: endonuclease [Nitrospiraceae bacterium]|nr:endonuclease [Nitrospiraceae bacterium]
MKVLIKIYNTLYSFYGPQYWWPGDTPFEIAVGAILTQNTNWGNVEKAIKNLKKEKVLTAKALHEMPHQKLASLIRPAGYFNIKAKRLKSFIDFLADNYNGSMKRMKKEEMGSLRKKLLDVHGIGPETADSILLYAGNHPVFVVDAYTKRIFSRHQVVKADAEYHDIQELFMKNLPHDVNPVRSLHNRKQSYSIGRLLPTKEASNGVKMFNEYHALIVKAGKDFCRTRKPLCSKCPLM